MEDSTLRAGIELPLEPAAAFDAVVDELSLALERRGMALRPGAGGAVLDGGEQVGLVERWEHGGRIGLAWHPASWEPGETTEIELLFEPAPGGTRLTLTHRGLGRVVGDERDLAGWFAGEVAAHVLAASAPRGLGDWLTDRWARRPSGPQSRETYRDPLHHRPNFVTILAELGLGPADELLEVGCGGGAFLEMALESGCRARAVDHSADMVRVARELNRRALEDGRLEVVQASAERLPFADETFTCAVMTGVFGFLAEPVRALSECRRVLREGGRLAVFTGSAALRGTPAAPEPVASRLRFYEDDELERLAAEAGFADVRVARPSMDDAARQVGVPEEHLSLFAGRHGQLLLARR
jgi:SAM-dependent methyltransferase